MNRNKIIPKSLLLFASPLFLIIAIKYTTNGGYGTGFLFVLLGAIFSLLTAVRLQGQKARNKWVDEFPNNITSIRSSRTVFTYYTDPWYHVCPLNAGIQLLLLLALFLTIVLPFLSTRTLTMLADNNTAFYSLIEMIGISTLWFWSLERTTFHDLTFHVPVTDFLKGHGMLKEFQKFTSFYPDNNSAKQARVFVRTKVPPHIKGNEITLRLMQIEAQIQEALKEEIPKDILYYETHRSITKE